MSPDDPEAFGLNEADTRSELIEPLLRAAGWGVVAGSRSAREQEVSQGRLKGAGGQRAAREVADFVLVYRGHQLAVIEAKKRSLGDTEGLGQAKRYAERLQTPFAYSTNGKGLYRVDMRTGAEGYVDGYMTPDEAWGAVFGESERAERYWRERFGAVPFEDRSGHWQPRYYQHIAITRATEAIASGRDRILLTLATGTGKTAIAFQIAWKLFQSRWNLKDWRATPADGEAPSRRPRILFLADRNILANQAFNAFSAFPDDALLRIAPDEIRRKNERLQRDGDAEAMNVATPQSLRRQVPKNAAIFFTIFQTFMTGRDAAGEPAPYFGDYPPNFFDLIIVDECHRGGANDESTWRAILDYFAPAVQIGLTATPRRDANADTYDYFGDPVYIYSLKEGINDGYLTPFKVRQVQTTLDTYVYTADDDVEEGEIEQGRRYVESDFNRIIEIKEREQHRVGVFMTNVNQAEKAIVFCATQDHAAAARDLINQAKTNKHTDYCVRVTANDGAIGEQHLRTFQNNEKSIPTVLTTSQKLSTGVDARNVRHIVLMRPVNSMIEFKQIIGRGTRLYDGKDYFTIWDFVKAYEHFNDPEWDGEPAEPVPVERDEKPEEDADAPVETEGDEEDAEKRPRRQRVRVKLADGKERQIQHMMATTFWHPDGTPMSAQQFLHQLFGELPAFFANEEELRTLWSDPETRRQMLNGLEEKGFGPEQLNEMQRIIDAERSDLYDVLAHVAFALAPVTREDRAEQARTAIATEYADRQQAFLDFVLGHYVRQGVRELDIEHLGTLLKLRYGDSLPDAIKDLGGVEATRAAFTGFQRRLYEPLTAA